MGTEQTGYQADSKHSFIGKYVCNLQTCQPKNKIVHLNNRFICSALCFFFFNIFVVVVFTVSIIICKTLVVIARPSACLSI